MLRAYTREDNRLAPTDFDPTSDVQIGTAVWYSLVDPTRDEDKFVESCLGIDIPTRREMQDIEPSARLYSEEGAEFMTITALVEDEAGQVVKTPHHLRAAQRPTGHRALRRPKTLPSLRAPRRPPHQR